MTSASPRDSSIARGITRDGSRTSPAMAAIRSKPCRAMNVKPMAANSPGPPLGKKGSRSPLMAAPLSPATAQPPTTINTANTTTLPMVAH